MTLGPVNAATGIGVRGLCCVIGTGTAVDLKGGREWDHGAEWCGEISDCVCLYDVVTSFSTMDVQPIL